MRSAPQRLSYTVQDLFRERPMLAGSLLEQYVTCGKSNCRCQQGEKHGPLYYLYWKDQGRSRSLYVPRERVPEMRRQIQNYRRFQQALSEGLQRQLKEWQRRLKEERNR